ncbi:MAG: cytidine deaminase [Terriglobales bacterium]
MNKPNLAADERERLIQAAYEAAKNAYAMYSQFEVGAALLTADGEVVQGCNVENASYGLTMCAERSAIFRAVSKFGPVMSIRAMAVVNSEKAPCSPCGACRQVIYEFGSEAAIIFLSTHGWEEACITDLLPYGFRLK